MLVSANVACGTARPDARGSRKAAIRIPSGADCARSEVLGFAARADMKTQQLRRFLTKAAIGRDAD
jgi:hypothetical protein